MTVPPDAWAAECALKKGDTQKRVSLFGAGGRTRTGTLSPAVDFESTTSTNSITPAGAFLL